MRILALGKWVVSLAAALVGLQGHANEAAWPTKPVRLVVPYSAGSTADMVGRILVDRLGARFKQPFVIDNRPGGGGEVGTQHVARSAPDGYTLLLTTGGPLVISPSLKKDLGYDLVKDFTPIADLAWIPVILVSHPSFPARTLPELIAELRKRPGHYAYASSGVGSYAHIAMEMFKQALGVSVNHVPYRGPSQAESDLVGGQVSLMLTGISTASVFLQNNRLRAYGVSSRERSRFVPDVPTLMEQGVKELVDYEVTSRTVLLAPAGTPKNIVADINAEINRALASPEFQEQLHTKNLLSHASTQPAKVSETLVNERTTWAKVIKAAGIQME
ncbi:Bug family tripartite tricarboxylate transporter substrate binding protein [Hydrogenophaga sp. BPS33]|uniref:Bug family tripartite tricarboxylate transporter substrate binding protein n=1 Tax=Hydrogenophaga sp. BPS33 TaxID=2651974 RepID=UPI00131F65AF|nr:tripartite tricarboxylate transporter substrate binding protein [Hydrogenophaga sp. BPS33]QHE87563.1 tripartite tricarboxylate transporter substrate binding protein [Hydrogenophaga sp. BPS33]